MRRWLNELLADANTNVECIAAREGCSMRKINMTISLAFLAPDLVKAAIDGRLPHGAGDEAARTRAIELATNIGKNQLADSPIKAIRVTNEQGAILFRVPIRRSG